ncbi:unnamed protein product [Prunus armeniaca]
MAVRNKDAGTNVKEAILKEIPEAKIDVMELDLSSLASVRKFGADFKYLDLALNILMHYGNSIQAFSSQDNIELHFATNNLGHFLLTDLLLETMKSTSRERKTEGRIVNSKLANILHANELTRRLKEEGAEVTANCLHPGTILTNLMRYDGFLKCILKVLGIFISKTVQQGAATTCFVALHPQLKGVGGEYLVDCNIAKPSSQAKDADLATRLWDFSLSLTNAE